MWKRFALPALLFLAGAMTAYIFETGEKKPETSLIAEGTFARSDLIGAWVPGDAPEKQGADTQEGGGQELTLSPDGTVTLMPADGPLAYRFWRLEGNRLILTHDSHEGRVPPSDAGLFTIRTLARDRLILMSQDGTERAYHRR